MSAPPKQTQTVKALLLVGGEGMRLRPVVSSTPKPLAPVGDRPFLELLVRQLQVQGIRRIVLCTGYRSHEIEETFGDGSDLQVTIEYSKETTPLGTAGAVKLARPHLENADEFLVLNGDSFLEIDFRSLLAFHRAHAGIASIAAVRMRNTDRYGTLRVGATKRVTSFVEKTASAGPGLINAGVYLFSSSVLKLIPERQASLEIDVLPRLLSLGLYAFEQKGIFIDIGTPADYMRAQELYERLSQAASFNRAALRA